MTNLQKKLTSAIAAGTLLLNVVTPALGLSFVIDGNASNSDNYINVDLEREVEVKQENDADVENDVTISTNTGRNTARDNTSGSVEIDTGDTEVGVLIENTLNTNAASVDLCGGCAFDGDFKISGNASKTDNDIEFDYKNKLEVEQKNDADVENDVDVTGNSGGNRAKDNTGGNVVIDTGDVVVNPVVILNTLNANYARVGGGDRDGGELSAWIIGNTRKSDNFINLDFKQKTEVEQENDADVENDVDVAGNSGRNRAKDNTGGMNEIDTGDVEVGVLVDTMANFNLADVEDCCLLDLEAGIKNNASKTDNDIELDLEDELEVKQDNDLDCDGGHGHKHGQIFDLLFGGGGHGRGGKCSDVDVTGNSGGNLVADSTGGEDPEVDTGDADVAVEVYNSGNVNTFGDVDFELPGDGGSSVSVDIDFGEIMDLLDDILGLLS